MRLMIFSGLVLVALFGLIAFTPSLRDSAINLSLSIKGLYHDKKEGLTNFIQDYIDQADKIKELREEVRGLRETSLKYEAARKELENLQYSLDIERRYDDPDVSLVRVLSYATLASQTKLWLSPGNDRDPKKILGLMKDGYAIGIAKVDNNHLLGMLNGDAGCSYSVYIGKNKVPGTVRTMDDGSLVVDYIPAWQSVSSGDSVLTSGLDGIFFEGIEVGVIGNIRHEEAYLRAELKVHSFSNRLSYVWLVDTKIPQITTLNQNEVPTRE